MPKRTSDWNKAQRLMLVRRSIKNIGHADVRHIREYLSRNYGFKNNESLRRRVYEDLADLEAIREIKCHDSKDGHAIKKVYTLFDEQPSIVGANAVKDFGGSFYVPSKRHLPWEITTVLDLEPRRGHLKIIFCFFGRFHLLSIPKSDLPVSLVVGRPFNLKEFIFPDQNFISEFGLRSAYLGIPAADLTLKPQEDLAGHAVFRFNENGRVTVEDLGTANKTFVSDEIKRDFAADIYGVILNQKMPISYAAGYWDRNIESGVAYREVDNGGNILNLPILVRLGKSIHFVIGDFEKPEESEIEKSFKKWKRLENSSSPDAANGLVYLTDYFVDETGLGDKENSTCKLNKKRPNQ